MTRQAIRHGRDLMPEHQHLDALIKDALESAADARGIPAVRRRELDDLIVLARSFIRLDPEARADVIKDVRERAEKTLPAASHVFFID